MNLKSLSIKTMISLSWFWLTDALALRVLRSHPLGLAMLEQIKQVHELIQELGMRRNQQQSLIAALSEMIAALDFLHDRKARALYNFFQALIAGSDDEEFVAWCEDMLQTLFPQGLAIINYSYADEAGEVMAIERQVPAEAVARMATVRVGEQSLADVYRAWISAGTELGQRVHERARMQARVAGNGTAVPEVSVVQARSAWIRMGRALLITADLMELSESDREALLSPLYRSVANAERSAGTPDGDVDAELPDAGDEDVMDAAPVDTDNVVAEDTAPAAEAVMVAGAANMATADQSDQLAS